jgi:hypothetical protein
MRVLYAQMMEEEGPLHPGPMHHIGRLFADPRSFGIGGIVRVPTFYPPHYPLDDAGDDGNAGSAGRHHHHHWARSLFLVLVDDNIVIPRLEKLYWFVSTVLDLPRLVHLAVRGMPSYPWGALVRRDTIDRLSLEIARPAALLTELRRLALAHR